MSKFTTATPIGDSPLTPASEPEGGPRAGLEQVQRTPVIGPFEVALMLLFVLVCRVLAVYSCPYYDDAFITFRYVENFASGLGLVFNPGAEWEPVLGTTTPGYAVLLSALRMLGVAPGAAALFVNLTVDLLIAALILRMLGNRRSVACAAVAIFGALPPLARISVGGMEAPLFTLLVLYACDAHARGRSSRSGWSAAFACTVRPEGVLLALGLAFVHVARRRRAEFLRFAIPVAIVGTVSTVLLTAYYGSPIPHSVVAKSSTHAARTWAVSVRRFGEILEQSFLPLRELWGLLPLVLFGAWRAFRRRDGLFGLSLFSCALVVSYLLARPHTWGWYYYLPVTAWAIWLALGLEPVLVRVEREVRRIYRAVLLSVLVLGVLAVFATTRMYPDLVTREIYKPMEEWARAEGIRARDAAVLASDIGAIGFLGGGTLLDCEGLVWPDALEFVGDGEHEAQDKYRAQMEMLDVYRPEYLMLVVMPDRLAAFEARPDLQAAYEPVARFNALGLRDLHPLAAELSPNYSQDYLFFRRRPEH